MIKNALIIIMLLCLWNTGCAQQVPENKPIQAEKKLIGAVQKDSLPGRPAAEKVWVKSNQWPNSLTPETFGKDVLRLEKDRITCDEDKAVMLYHWFTRCFGRSGSPFEGPKGFEGVPLDEWKDFHCYGQGLCDRWGRLGAVIFNGAGIPSRKTGTPSHTMMEAWYKDRDGKSRWHLFDPHQGWYLYSRDKGHIMSGHEIGDYVDLYYKYTKTSIPYFVRDKMPRPSVLPDSKETLRAQKRYFKSLVYSQVWPADHDVRMSIPTGASFTRYWYPKQECYVYQKGAKFNNNHCKLGYHDPTPVKYQDGKIKDPENYPFWKPYMMTCPFCKIQVKPQGHGVFLYKPPLTGNAFSKETWLCQNIVTDTDPDKPRVHPENPIESGVLVYEVKSPYVIADSKVRARLWRKSRDWRNDLAFFISLDNGETWHIVYTTKKLEAQTPFDIEIDIGRERWNKDKASVHGTYGFLLRIDMMGVRNSSDVGLEELEIENTVLLNMWTLPFLRPGNNQISVHAQAVKPGKELSITYVWDDTEGKNRTVTKTLKQLPARFNIKAAGKKPDDIRMRSISLSVPGPPQVKRKFKSPPPLPKPETCILKAEPARQIPVIDGKLDDAVWKNAASLKGFYSNKTIEVLNKETKTEIKYLYDKVNLYLAIHCQEPDADEWNTIVTERDSGVWRDNSIEIFICPSGKNTEYWQIVTNSLGTLFDAFHSQPGKGDKSKNLTIQAKGIRTKEKWSVELAIPLKELGINPAAGSTRINMFRTIWGDTYGYGNTPVEEQALSPSPKTYHDPKRFGVLEFVQTGK